MKQKNKYEKDDENKKTGLITSPNMVKTVMLICPKIKIIGSLQYFSSFSCLSIHSSNYMQHLLEKCGNIFQKPSKGLHLIRSFSHQIPFDPTHSLQTLNITITIPPKLQKINEHKFASQRTYINQVNKLTMSFPRVLNSRSSSFQLEGHDTDHINQQMTKDKARTSQIGQTSQYTKPSPTKPRESINRRRTRYKPEYQKFFLFVFPQKKLCNKLGSLWGFKYKNKLE